MIDKINKISFILLALLVILILPGIPATVHAYSVSGIIDFSYTDITNKSGNSKQTESYSVQHYSINVASYVLDPRLLRYSAGVGYMLYSSDKSNDTKSLTYSLTASLLPGKLVSAELFSLYLLSNKLLKIRELYSRTSLVPWCLVLFYQ